MQIEAEQTFTLEFPGTPQEALAFLRDPARSLAHVRFLRYAFHFTAHIEMPSAEKWGGAAFEKMVRAAAERTLARLARELPEGMARGYTYPD